MWGRDMHYDWRARENRQAFIGPKTVIASIILDGSPKIWPGSIEVSTEQQAREQVSEFHQKGADFIKVYSNLSREAYFAIAEESKSLGIPFAGHVPVSVTIAEASDAGQQSIEHLFQLDIETSDSFIAAREEFRSGDRTDQSYLEFQQKVYIGYGGEKTSMLYKKFVENDTWLSPTLTYHRNQAYMEDRPELDKERLTYLPTQTTEPWMVRAEQVRERRTPQMQIFAHREFEHQQRMVGDMHAAGVKIIAGTDVRNPFCFPGFSLHDELFLLVESGLSPMAALQAATINAAEFAGRLADSGTIEEGNIADLVLLDANPLEDIRNTTKISSVVLNGILHDRRALSEMLRTARELAGN